MASLGNNPIDIAAIQTFGQNQSSNPIDFAARQTFGMPTAQTAQSGQANQAGQASKALPGITAQAGATQSGGQVATPQDQGPSQQRVTNAQLGKHWQDISSDNSSYKAMFGNQPYVKDGSDPQLLSLLQEALQKAPELQSTPLAEHVAAGKVGPEDIKSLQSFLQSKGYSVGPPGVDGKFGPLTDKALEHFLHGDPADMSAKGQGAAKTPAVSATTPGASTPKAQAHKPAPEVLEA